MRIDKWLWAGRFYKTRTLAAQAVEAGQARIGDERVKPAHVVRIGDTVTIRKQGLAWVVEVTAVSDRRGSATIAATLYQETPGSLAERTEELARRKAAMAGQPVLAGRPTKRDRRKLADFLDEP